MTKYIEQSDLDAYRADSYMHDICEMQNEIDGLQQENKDLKQMITDLEYEIKNHKEIRNMLDVELARSNRKLEDFKRTYKV